MISDTLSETVAAIRRYQDEPIFAEVYEPIEREIEIVVYFLTGLQGSLDTTNDVLRAELLAQIRQAAPSLEALTRRVNLLRALHGGVPQPPDPVRFDVLHNGHIPIDPAVLRLELAENFRRGTS
jgi:hypothetical protein